MAAMLAHVSGALSVSPAQRIAASEALCRRMSWPRARHQHDVQGHAAPQFTAGGNASPHSPCRHLLRRIMQPEAWVERLTRGLLTAGHDAAMELAVRILRVGDPFVPRGLEGVCVHVHVTDGPEALGWDVRVWIPDRAGSPAADPGHGEVVSVANAAVVEDMARRPALYESAFSELEAKRAAVDGSLRT